MYIFFSIVVFLFIFSLVVLVHELGHFVAAKKSGVCVEEFGFGMPPKIFGIKKGETTYSINWIPFGGFVRMLGEDSEAKNKKDTKRSFAGQPLRKQALIVCAGVFMNLLLAFVLLTIGFVFGMEPLIATEEDFMNAIRGGAIELSVGAPIEEENQDDLVYAPRLKYFADESSVFNTILQNGDLIIAVNGEQLLTEEDLLSTLKENAGGTVLLTIYSNGQNEEISFTLPSNYPVISYVENDSPADEIGLMVGDKVKTVGGQNVTKSDDVISLTQEYAVDGVIAYEILRGEEVIDFNVPLRAEDSRVGIGLSDLISSYGDLSFYSSYVPHTLVKINPVSYGWGAPKMAFLEMIRLGKITIAMFGSVLAQFFTAGSIPAGVTGPVGIAQMTSVTLKYGFMAMLRFVALLSLSLGVINILPIPAMDGGHFAIILYKAITGHKPNPKWERAIHLSGFVLLGLLLVYVTFNDVLNLF